MADELEVEQKIRSQTSNEEIEYTIDTTRWTSSPASPSVVAYDESNWGDVTTTVFPTNTPSASSSTITLSVMKSLTVGHKYRVHVRFQDGGNNKFEAYFRVHCVI